eukprot:m.301944 g.301944  ORF g.301944 m.301944 type:complete len:169 (-) comp16431_c0_seq8:363-869(-)
MIDLESCNDTVLARQQHLQHIGFRNGLGEGIQDFPEQSCFPSESNFDVLNGVSYDKGCYLGQELTMRTKTLGQTRKRLVPCILTAPDGGSLLPFIDRMEANHPVFLDTGKTIGRMRSFTKLSDTEVGALVLLRLEHLQSKLHASMDGDDQHVTVQPIIPAWWPETLLT